MTSPDEQSPQTAQRTQPPQPHRHGGGHEAAPEGLGARLRARGFRVTAQREAILAAVDTLGHATPDEVLTEVQRTSPQVNASTVYRTLEVFEELGLVRHAHLSDRAPTYHSVRGAAHFHLVCRVCDRVESVPPQVAEPMVEALHGSHDFIADVGHLTVFGWCTRCRDTPGGTHD